MKALGPLPSQSRLAEVDAAPSAGSTATAREGTESTAPTGSGEPEDHAASDASAQHDENFLEQVKWLLDLIDLSENLPDGTTSRSSEGGDK